MYSRSSSTSTSTSSPLAEFHDNTIGHFNLHQISNESYGERRNVDMRCFPYKIHPHVPTFRGRLSTLNKLKTSVSNHQITVVSGRGGIGKSQLVKKFATENKTEYEENILWINAESVEEISKAFKTLFRVFYYDDEKIHVDLLTTIKYVYNYFESSTLIVFDNATDEKICEYLPNEDQFDNIKVIVTSQCNNWQNVILLDCVDECEAIDIFKGIMKEKYTISCDDEWRQLANELGRLPLAIQISGAYIYAEYDDLKPEYCVEEYIKEIGDKPEKLLEYTTNECKISLVDTLELSLKKMQICQDNTKIKRKTNNISCMHLLNICAHLNPDFITKEQLLKFFDDELASLVIEFLRVIIKYSLLTCEKNYISIHNEIQKNILYLQNKQQTNKIYFHEILKQIIREEELFYDHRITTMDYAEKNLKIAVNYYNKTKCVKYLKMLTQYACYKTLNIIFNSMCCSSRNFKIKNNALLYEAVLSRNAETVKLILKYTNKVNIKNERGWTPLRIAVELKCCEIQDLLIKNGALEEQTKNGVTLLHECLRDGHVILAKYLIDIPLVLNIRDNDGNTVLHYAAMNTNINNKYHRLLLKLVEKVEAVDMANKYGRLALHVCAEFDNLVMAKMLVDKNTDIYWQDKKGNTPLLLATIHKNVKMIKYLCEIDDRNINIIIKNKKGCIVLHHAINLGMDDIAVYFAKKRIDSTLIKDNSGNTALHLAVRLMRNTILPGLLEATQQNIHVTNNDGDTPLSLAKDIKNFDAVLCLEEYKPYII